MLHLILGRSGSGKTQYIRSLLRDLAKQGSTRYDPARAGTIFL